MQGSVVIETELPPSLSAAARDLIRMLLAMPLRPANPATAFLAGTAPSTWRLQAFGVFAVRGDEIEALIGVPSRPVFYPERSLETPVFRSRHHSEKAIPNLFAKDRRLSFRIGLSV